MTNETAPSTTLRPERRDILPLLLWLTVLFLTWLFMHGADRFLAMTPEALGKYFPLRWILIAHITAGGGSLVCGLLQFWPKLRRYSIGAHRVLGFVYLLAVLVSSLCALILAVTTSYEVGWAYAFSLQVWVSVWISATAIAWYAAVRRNVSLHRQWMVRSYLVTLAFIISGLALKLPFVARLGSFAEVSPAFFWAGWAVPLYFYELLLGRSGLGRRR